MENLVEFYYEKLKNSQEPNKVLMELFYEVTGINVGRSEIIMINKLLKLFGRFTLFFSIVDLSSVKSLEGNLYGLLYTICNRRFERAHNNETVNAFESLSRELNSLEKQIEKISKKKIKAPSSEGL